jgi:hypothetical protein
VIVALMLVLTSAPVAGGAEARTSLAAARPTLQVAPARPAIGRSVTISGRHLRPNTYYTLLLSVPNAQKPKIRAFLGALGRTDGNGTFSVRTTMPVVVQCGPAVIFATAAKASTSVMARITLTGCKASSTVKSPPPPPGGKKKSKHKKP